MLSKDNFQLEIVMHERGVPPRFRIYPLFKGKAIEPEDVTSGIQLHRLGGKVDEIQFRKENDYLRSNEIIEEPHSFDIKVTARWKNNAYSWEYSQIEGRVSITPEAARNSGIITKTAGPAQMETTLELPGEIKLNADTLVHVVPRLSGVVKEVNKNLGDTVEHGDIFAVIYSRELAELKSRYVATQKRLELRRATYDRIKRLWKQKISSEKDYLASRQLLAEAEINLQEIKQKLLILGLSESALEDLPEKTEKDLARYEVRALFSGRVIEKHISIGESIKKDADIFVIADLSSVWAAVTVYAKDLNMVKVGQKVTVRSDILDLESYGTLTYLGPLVGVHTRTARGIVVVQNPEGLWRPGLFVTVEVVKEEITAPLAVSVEALQVINGMTGVFVQYGNTYEFRPLELGRNNGRWAEVLKGLSAGEVYVAQNSFILKAEIGKSGATHDH